MVQNLETFSVQVTCGLDPTSGQHTITGIDPPTLRLHIEDSATWKISGLPSGFSLLFDFVSPHAPDGLFGSTSANPVVGDGSEVEFSGNSFFQPDETQRDYSYSIKLQDSSGRILVSHDPMIDSLGQPPGPDDGGGS
ncbi:MAG: hypothetical protein JF614_18935 [Acidobacteria bacterium]|nr:hypothetical protein [Acidobacteriota bacterium]